MMYAKLALENVKKSTKDYLIYIVTLTACISMFYAFLSISSNYYDPNIGAEFNLDILGDGIKYAILLITVLLMFLMQYVNHFMIQRRKREFAIQSIIGMEQSTIARLFFVESLIMGIFSLIVGIGLGGVFSQFITAMLLQMYHKPFEFSFMLFPDTIILTILFFCICFATVGLSQVRTIRKIKIIDMLNADRKNDILGTPHKWIYKLFPVNFVLYLLITFYNIRTLSYYFNGEFELVIKIWSAISIIVPILMLITHIRERFRRKEQNTVKQLFLIECIGLLELIILSILPVFKVYLAMPMDKGAFNVTMRTIEVNDNSAIIFIMQTGLTYSAIILFVTCFTILALQQLSDSGKYKYRFRVLRNMGVEEPHIRKLILKQLAVWFGVPIILALILSGAFLVFLFVGFHMQIAVYIGVQRLVQQLLIVLAILGVLLISYFISTWVLFNKSASA